MSEVSRLAKLLRPYWLRDRGDGTTVVNNTYITETGGGGGGGTGGMVPQSLTLTAGLGMTGGGDLSDDRTFNVGAGAGIIVNADDVALATTVAGAGLTYSSGVLAVASGNTGLVVNANDVTLTLASNAGLEISSGLKMGTPTDMSVASTTSSVSGTTHVHRLITSSNPGVAASLLATDANGFLELVRLIGSNRVRTPLLDTASGNMTLTPAGGTVVVSGSASVGEDLTVDGTALVVDGSENAIGINVVPDGAASLDIRAGFTSDHSQRIRRISGQTGRLWRIEDTSGNELIVLDSVGNLQSGQPGFVSGLTGWRISPVGNAEFNNGRFRGELHAAVMVFDEVSVENGTKLVTVHGGVLHLDVTLISTATVVRFEVQSTAFGDQDYLNVETTEFGDQAYLDSQTVENRLHVKNPDTGHYKLFSQGEVLRMKVWTGTAITDTWMKVNSARDEGDHWSYAVTVVSGSLPVTYTEGAAIAGYGQSGDGAIRISADDDYGPLIDVFTVGEQPWNGQIYPHVRMGRLDGVGVPGVSGILQWGLIAGANLADANSPYAVLSNLMQYMYKVKSEWHDGANITGRIEASGRVRFGTNVDNPANTFMDVNPLLGLATFRGAIEVLSGSSGYGNLADKPTLGALAPLNSVDLATGEVTNKTLANVADGGGRGALNSTIISGGNIRVGTGTKDSNLDGFHIDSTEIVGQTSGVDQVVMGTNGGIGFGAGAGLLDATGIALATNNSSYDSLAAYKVLHKTSGTLIGRVAGWTVTGSPNQNIIELRSPSRASHWSYAAVRSESPSGQNAIILLETVINSTTKSAIFVDGANDSIAFQTQATIRATVTNDGIEADNMINVETTAW
ncbi:MAG: hypothetical protein ACOYD4_06855 [Solirubrobacterales bacterium]